MASKDLNTGPAAPPPGPLPKSHSLSQRDDVRGHRDDVVVLPEHGIVPLPDPPLAGRVERVGRRDVGKPAARRRELVPGVVEREVALRVL